MKILLDAIVAINKRIVAAVDDEDYYDCALFALAGNKLIEAKATTREEIEKILKEELGKEIYTDLYAELQW